MHLTRRHAMIAGAAGLTLAGRPAAAADGRLLFDVYRNDGYIGSHEILFRQVGDRLETDIAIDLDVKFAFITVYRYRHRNHEIYEGGQLVQMSSRTDDNGKKLSVDVHREGDELVIHGADGRLRVAGDLVPTTYWQPTSIAASAWIDSQHGRVLNSEVTDLGEAPIEYDGRTVLCRHFRKEGDLSLDLWYGPDGWTTLAFELSGSRFTYRRRPESDVASLPQAVAS